MKDTTMSISMYQASVPRIVNMLTNLNHLLSKAHAHVESKKWNESALTQFRLYPDMFPLTRLIARRMYSCWNLFVASASPKSDAVSRNVSFSGVRMKAMSSA